MALRNWIDRNLGFGALFYLAIVAAIAAIAIIVGAAIMLAS